MKPLFYLLFTAFLLFFQPFCHAQKPEENALLWQISGKNLSQPSYLFGTIHMICSGELNLSEAVKAKLQSSEQLVLELDFDEPELMQKMQQKVTMKDGKTLDQFLNEEEYELVRTYFQDSLSMPMAAVNSIKPFFLNSMMAVGFMGCRPASFEGTLTQLAGESNMEVKGLETIDYQFELIDQIPYEKQAQMVVESITEYEKTKAVFDDMVKKYEQEDVNGLYKLTQENFGDMEAFAKILITDRNQHWVPRIAEMAEEKSTFFAVGAGHLGGPEGVIALLREEGFTVKPIKH